MIERGPENTRSNCPLADKLVDVPVRSVPALTAARLRELLHYDPETGVFTRRVRTSTRIKAGDVAGWANGKGYLLISVDGRDHYAHRLAWLYTHGAWPTNEIDHRNTVRNDNRIANLRDVSGAVNSQNQRRAPAHNKSCGLLGVTWNKQIRKWHAQIQVDGKKRSIGYFATAELAHSAYLAAKREHHPGCTV